MPKAYVVAAEGEQLKVTIQKQGEVSTPVVKHTIEIVDGMPIPKTEQVGSKTEMQWIDHAIVGPFAGESREFTVDAATRLIVSPA